MKKFKTINYKGQKLVLYVGEYTNGKVYVKAVSMGEDYCDITVNLDGVSVSKGVAHISSDVPSDLLEALVEANVVVRVGEEPYNFGRYVCVCFPDLC